MSISDASVGEQQPVKLKRIMRPLSEDQWRLARAQFESGGLDVTQARIAAVFNTSLSMVQKRSAAEKWSKGAIIVKNARKHLQLATDNALAKAAESTGAAVAKTLMKELEPWIEKEKRAHILRAVKRSKRAFKRIDALTEGYETQDAKTGNVVALLPTPKDEMMFANAEDKYDGIIRRNLGMSEGSALGGSLSLRVLTGNVAIEATAGPG